MDCAKFEIFMMKYFDNEVNEIDKTKLEQHVKVCDKCKAEFDEMKNAIMVLEEEDMIDIPSNLENMVMNEIYKIDIYEPKANKIKPRLKHYALGVFALSTIISMAVYYFLWSNVGFFRIIVKFLGENINKILNMLREVYIECVDVFYALVGEYYYVIIFLMVMAYAVKLLLSHYIDSLSISREA